MLAHANTKFMPPPRVRRARGRGEDAALADAADHKRRRAGIGPRGLVCCMSSYTPLCEKGPVDSKHEVRSLARHDESESRPAGRQASRILQRETERGLTLPGPVIIILVIIIIIVWRGSHPAPAPPLLLFHLLPRWGLRHEAELNRRLLRCCMRRQDTRARNLTELPAGETLVIEPASRCAPGYYSTR